ncbi:MAG: DUF4976 domain-containing protein, partial [Gemmatimonadales bacterium]
LGELNLSPARTPNIDRIAREGAAFTNAFVIHSLCSPSRATILTGLRSTVHGVMNNRTPLPRSQPTVATALQAAGYRTGFVGKWHMATQGERQPGFDAWVSFEGQGTYMNPTLVVGEERVSVEGHISDILVDRAIGFLEENADRPFFLVLSHKAVHYPFEPQPDLLGLFADVPITPPLSFGEDIDAAGKPSFMKERPLLADTVGLRTLSHAYYETLYGVDRSLGRFFDQLRALGLDDNTALIVTSDNGHFFGEHNKFDKRLAYEESIRIPLVVRYPDWFEPGVQFDPLTLNLDFATTMLDMANVAPTWRIDGISLRDLASDPSARTSFVYEYFNDPDIPQIPRILAIRTRSEKLITYPDSPFPSEFYDLDTDPHELVNLLAAP